MTADHPTVETIADYRAGLLRPPHQDSVLAHLSGCADCTAADQAVAEASAILADASADVVPMPADVATRLDEALRQAGAERADAAQGATVVPLDRRAPSEASQRSRRRTWPLLAAAAVAVVAVGTVVIDDLDLSPGGSADSSVAADAPADDVADDAPGDPAPGAGVPESAAESELNSANETDNSAAPSRSRLTRLSAASLPKYAEGLTLASPAQYQVADRCAPAPAPPSDVVATVRWRGAPATLVVDRVARQATVLDCETASTVLFRTGY